MPAGRLLAGRQLHGSVPEREQDQQEPVATAGRRLPLPGVQTEGVGAADGRQTRPLQGSIHQLRRTVGQSPIRIDSSIHSFISVALLSLPF